MSALLQEISDRLRIIESRLTNIVDKEFLTFDEAMEYLDCSRTTLNNYRAKNLLSSYKVGRKVFVKRDELVAFIEENLLRPGEAA